MLLGSKAEKIFARGFDIWLENGKRKRESRFASKQMAENAVARIKISEKEGKINYKQENFRWWLKF